MIRQAASSDDIDSARVLFREYASALGIDLCFQNFEQELRDLPGAYAPPSGALLLARAGEEAVGCVALRRLDAARCDMKRLYVRRALHRGPRPRRAVSREGAGGALAVHSAAAAAACGFRKRSNQAIQRS